MHQRTHKSNSSNPSRQEKSSPFFRHTAIVQAKQNSSTPLTQEEIENDAFAQNKFEAVGLQIKQTKGTITPIEQERLGVLQAKMDDLLIQRQERASRFGHHLANISLHFPDRPVSTPVQPKLPFGLSTVSDTQQSGQKSSDTSSNGRRSLVQRIPTTQNHLGSPIQAKLMIGQPGDKYEQEADRVARQVVQQLNVPKLKGFQSVSLIQQMKIPEKDKDWRNKAIEKVESYEGDLKKDDLNKMNVCGDSARLIYAAVAQKLAGEGTGVESLIAAITNAEGNRRKGQVFIFFVNANIVGHFFTILQNGKEATIMQGYLDKISIAENIAQKGEGRKIRDTGKLKEDLRLLIKLRDEQLQVGNPNDGTSENIIALGKVHTRLFGPGTDEKERKWISQKIFFYKLEKLKWEASFAEGSGEELGTEKRGECTIF
jgi:hypothetical protein